MPTAADPITVTITHRHPADASRVTYYTATVGDVTIEVNAISRKIGWCSDWASLGLMMARGGHPLIAEQHHGPDTFGAVTWTVDAAALPRPYMLELANRIERGRAVGNMWVVTRRPIGLSGIVQTFTGPGAEDAARAWIAAQPGAPTAAPGCHA